MGDMHFKRPRTSLKARLVCKRVDTPRLTSTSTGDIEERSSSETPSGKSESICSITEEPGSDITLSLSSDIWIDTSMLESRVLAPLVSIDVRLSFHRLSNSEQLVYCAWVAMRAMARGSPSATLISSLNPGEFSGTSEIDI